MLLIRAFSGPRAALIWGYAMDLRLPYLVSIPAGFILAYGEATDAWNSRVQLLVLGLLLTIFTAKAAANSATSKVNLRLPVSSRKLAATSIAATNIFATLFSTAYFATIGLVAKNGESIDSIHVLAVFVLGLHGFCLKTIYGNSASRIASIFLSITTTGLIGLFFVAISWNWIPNAKMHLIYLLPLIAVANISYFFLLAWLYERQRIGAQRNIAPDTRVTKRTHYISSGQTDDAMADSEIGDKSFLSRFTAEIWYTRSVLFGSCMVHYSFWTCVPLMFLYGALILEFFPAQFPEHLYALSLVILSGRFGWWWYRAVPQRPLSEWTESRFISEIMGIVTLAGVAIFWPLYVLTSDSETTLSISNLFVALWIVWTGLAFSPCIITYLILGFIYHNAFTEQLPLTSSDICSLWLFALAFFQRWRSRPYRPSGSRWLLALIMLILVILGRISELESLKYIVWIGRELLGVLLVIALLTHHVLYQIASKNDAYRCGLLLSGLALLTTAVVVTTGLPNEPAHGVTATFLTYGYAPSLFLPIVVMPHYLAWQIIHSGVYRRMRERML